VADFTIKAHDERPSIQATLFTGGVAVDLTSATGVDFIMALASGGAPKVNAAAVVADAINGVVRYDWISADTDTPGDYEAEWQVTWADSDTQTFPTASYHTISVLADLDGA
jgi:hypothetical protein